MPKTLNIAVIGAGTMAQAVHLPILRRRWDRFAVAALVDHSPRRRRESAEVWGIEEDRRYEKVADLIAAVRAKTVTIDAALLSTDGLHVDDLLALMKRGIPVLVEPPLGYSAEEVARVADFERMTGRRLLMMAYPQQYDDSVLQMSEHIATKDLRMLDHEVLMPASQPLFGGAHVTTASYDLPTEVRSERRKALQAAVESGTGGGATQRDRDLYVKGLLTGVAHQMSVIEAAYGPIARLSAVRHWPKGVIPGSIELLGELEGGAQVRLVWHYLPFAPEYSETVEVLSARRRMRLELPAPSHGDNRSTVSLREKKAGVVQEISTVATKGSAELMWEAFHSFVEKGNLPVSGAVEALAQVTLLREVLATIVAADGRSLEPEEAEEAVATEEAEVAVATEATEATEETEGEVSAGTAAADEGGVAAGTAPAAAEEPTAEEGPMSVEAPTATDAASPEMETPQELPLAAAERPVMPSTDPGLLPSDPELLPSDPETLPSDPEPAAGSREQPVADPAVPPAVEPARELPAEEIVNVWDLDADRAPATDPVADEDPAVAPITPSPEDRGR